MEIIIKVEVKEIAALALAAQERQSEQDIDLDSLRQLADEKFKELFQP